MNDGSVVAIGPAQSGLSSYGSADCRHAIAASISGGKVVWALPGGIPVRPLAYSAATIERFGMPTGVTESEPSNAGSANGVWKCRPLGTREYTRSVQPYLGATAARCISVPPGVSHSGSVSAI